METRNAKPSYGYSLEGVTPIQNMELSKVVGIRTEETEEGKETARNWHRRDGEERGYEVRTH